jgi:hypothetical protein
MILYDPRHLFTGRIGGVMVFNANNISVISQQKSNEAMEIEETRTNSDNSDSSPLIRYIVHSVTSYSKHDLRNTVVSLL